MILARMDGSSLQVEISRHRLGLRVHVSGEETFENTVAYWQSIVEHLDNAHAPGLLLVDELRGAPLSESQWLELVVSMQGSHLGRFRIAHVKPRGLNDIEYCELFACDAGYDARVFVDEHAAEHWLAGA